MDIFQAIRRNEPISVAVLEDLPDINVKNVDGQGLLHTAIAYGNHSLIAPLMKTGIDVNATDRNGQTPLHFAAAHKDLIAAEQLLCGGGEVAIEDKHGNTALWTAVFNARGKYDVVGVFMRYGGQRLSRKKNRHGKSPLDFARQIGDSQLAVMLGE